MDDGTFTKRTLKITQKKGEKHMDENMKLIMAEFAKINTRLDQLDAKVTELDAKVTELDVKVTELDTRLTNVEKIIKESELDKMNTRLGMMDLKLDKLQDNYERLDATMREISSEVANGFYKTKHQIKKLEDQGTTVVKILEYRELLPVRQ